MTKLPLTGQHTYVYARSLLTAASQSSAKMANMKRLLQELEAAASAK
jgi:hypothetical protein